ncbi:MAG: hypothetical protein AAF483_16820, partial [Planctomycetota bacterium]
MRRKPRFIPSQRLLHLVCEEGQERDFLRPERFRMRRMLDRGEQTDEAEQKLQEKWQGAWEEVPDRSSFLMDPPRRHLCITIGAGVGKTKSSQQTQYLRAQSQAGELAVLLDISQLPKASRSYLDCDQAEDALIVQAILDTASGSDGGENAAAGSNMQGCSPDSIRRLVRRKIRNRKFSLIVDGFDQIDMDDDREARNIISALQRFLHAYPTIRCVADGRPWSIQHFWKELFGHPQQQQKWCFAQVDEFTEEEVKQYLGSKRAEALELLEAELMAVPRFVERLRTIAPARLHELRTGAEVYWESLFQMLEDGCDRQAAEVTVDDLIPIMALVAFQMTVESKSVRVRRGKEYEQFRDNAIKRGAKVLRIDDLSRREQVKEFQALYEQVLSLNVGFDHLLLDNHKAEEVHWQDRTLQAFMAAVWITRFAGEDEVQWLSENLHIRADDSTAPVYETWRFACEMPSDERLFPDSLAHVFDPETYA